MAVPRAQPEAFIAKGPASFKVERVTQSRQRAQMLEGALTPWGDFALEGDTLYAHIPDDVWAAEAVLRVAWQILTLRTVLCASRPIIWIAQHPDFCHVLRTKLGAASLELSFADARRQDLCSSQDAPREE